LKAVQNKGYVLKFLLLKMQNDFSIVMEAIKNSNNPFILYFASNELKEDYRIVLEAVKKNGFSLKYASNNLKKHQLICLEAIKNNIDAFHFIDISLKNDKEFIIDAYLYNKDIIKIYENKDFLLNIDKIENLIFDEGSLYILKIFKIIMKFENYKSIIYHLYNKMEFEILELNINDYICDNIHLYPLFFSYLLEKKNYNLIYNNENLNEFMKNYGFYILNLNDINNDFDKEELMNEIEKKFNPIKIIWI